MGGQTSVKSIKQFFYIFTMVRGDNSSEHPSAHSARPQLALLPHQCGTSARPEPDEMVPKTSGMRDLSLARR